MKTLIHKAPAAFIALAAVTLAVGIGASIAPLESARADETEPIPLVMVVVGFDGGNDPDAALPYDGDYDWNVSLFGEGESPASYYRDMSNGAFTFVPAHERSEVGVDGNMNIHDRADDGVVHIMLHRAHGAWGPVNVDSAVTREFGAMVMEAIEATGTYVDFRSYDANGDGMLSQRELEICVCIAGYEASTVVDFRRGDIPLMWSHSGTLDILGDEARTVDGLLFESYIAIAEKDWSESEPLDTAEPEPLGVVYHELGHALGLPDMYAVAVTEGPWEDCVVGPLSLMDSGGWQFADDGAGWRNIPTALDAWSRYVLGWTQPDIVMRGGDYAVSSQLSENGYRCLVIPTDDADEYFLVENRQAEGHDASLWPEYIGDNGLVIWHIDNGMYKRYYGANMMNDADHHPGVMCEQPDDDGAIWLSLYNDANDIPEAREDAGVFLQVVSEPGRDMIVHVELDERRVMRNSAHLLQDAARYDLGPQRPILGEVARIVETAALAAL